MAEGGSDAKEDATTQVGEIGDSLPGQTVQSQRPAPEVKAEPTCRVLRQSDIRKWTSPHAAEAGKYLVFLLPISLCNAYGVI